MIFNQSMQIYGNERKQRLLSLFAGNRNAIKTTPPPRNSAIYKLYENGPEFRGMRLGMHIRDILNYFGDIDLSEPVEGFEQFDALTLTIADETPDELENFNKKGIFNYTPGWAYLDKSKFAELAGLKEIRLSFVSNLCNEIDLCFDETFIWTDIEEFTDVIANLTGLNDWEITGSQNSRKLTNNELNSFVVIWKDAEKIAINGYSQFSFSTSDEIYNLLEQETLEADYGWENVKWGMNLHEIIEAYPKSELLAEPNIYHHNDQKYEAPIRIRNFPLLGEPYQMDFVVDSTNKLTGVILGLNNDKPMETKFVNLANSLKQKYGSPEVLRNGNSLQWKQSNIEITLNYVAVTFSNSYFIRLIYWNY